MISLALQVNEAINSSPPEKMAAIFEDNIFRCISMNEKFCILIKISPKFVPKGPIDITQCRFR